MNKLIVLTGMLATGKSTLTRAISKQLNIPYLSKDEIKEELVDKYGYKNREENRVHSINAVQKIFDAVKLNIQNGNDVIAEANFRNNELQTLKQIALRYNAKFILIGVVGNNSILYERFLKRLPTRHKAHISLGLDKDFNKFISYNNEMKNQFSDIDHFELDTTKLSLEDSIIACAKYIKE